MRKEPRSWTPPAKLAIMAIRRGLAGLTMRRLVLLLCVLAAGALPAQAKALRFPQTGKHVFLVDLPKGWQTKTDARGGRARRRGQRGALAPLRSGGERDAARSARAGRFVYRLDRGRPQAAARGRPQRATAV